MKWFYIILGMICVLSWATYKEISFRNSPQFHIGDCVKDTVIEIWETPDIYLIKDTGVNNYRIIKWDKDLRKWGEYPYTRSYVMNNDKWEKIDCPCTGENKICPLTH